MVVQFESWDAAPNCHLRADLTGVRSRDGGFHGDESVGGGDASPGEVANGRLLRRVHRQNERIVHEGSSAAGCQGEWALRQSLDKLLSSVYRFYARGHWPGEPGYKETEEYRRLMQARIKAGNEDL